MKPSQDYPLERQEDAHTDDDSDMDLNHTRATELPAMRITNDQQVRGTLSEIMDGILETGGMLVLSMLAILVFGRVRTFDQYCLYSCR